MVGCCCTVLSFPGVRVDPLHGVSPAGGVEDIPQHAAIDVPGTALADSSYIWAVRKVGKSLWVGMICTLRN